MPDRHRDTVTAFALPPVTRHRDIACRNEDATLFYPPAGQKSDAAKTICGRCPHQVECLDWALETRQAFGTWGGVTAEERKRLLDFMRWMR